MATSSSNLIWCTNGPVSLQLRIPGDQHPAVGALLGLAPDTERISLFDAITGDRL